MGEDRDIRAGKKATKPVLPENPHKNHRSRLRRRFLSSGLSSFEPHQVLELLLFFAIPRRDTNPTAHGLVSVFGGLDGVFEATPEELCRVSGVAAHTASFLKAFAAVGRTPARAGVGRGFSSMEELCEYATSLFAPEKRETYALFFNASLELIESCRYEGAPHDAHFPVEEPLKAALRNRASAVLLAHSHETALPLTEDLDITRHFMTAFARLEVDLIEHYLVASRDYAALLFRATGRTSSLPLSVKGGASFGIGTERETEMALLTSLMTLAGSGRAVVDALFDRFGTLYAVLSASAEELLSVGLSESEAVLLRLVYAIEAYRLAARRPPSCRETAALAHYLSEYFRGVLEEKLILLLFDGGGTALSITDLTEGSSNRVSVPYRRLSSVAALPAARYAMVAHNHPGGCGDASEEDQCAALGVGEALSHLGVEFLGHFILSESDCVFFGE